ncbi:MAG TPA: MFS transporter [Actinospica sp.]|nr:MFS transporter [Actinospica sp.]
MTDTGLLRQLRNPPGGRDARIMLTAQFLDRTGTGVWNAAEVLYFTVVAGLDARGIGLLIGVGAAAGILGSPVAGRLAGRHSVRTLLISCHLLRMVTLCAMLASTRFAVLLPAVAVTFFCDRAAKTLEMLFATDVAGPERATYQALFRSVANAGFAIGAGIAAIGLAVGTRDAYRALILLDAFSFVVCSLLVRRVRTDARPHARDEAPAAEKTASNPWRDPGYLAFVFLDIFMTTDDPILSVGLPLWLITRTSAPHALIPAFLALNTVLVVVLQMRISAATKGPLDATTAVARYGFILLATCVCIAAAPEFGTLFASLALLLATGLQTLAELMRSVSSWELAVALAPNDARPAYLGVAGMSQSIQKSAGPLLLTSVVMVAGPVGWLALGGAVAGISALQSRSCRRTLYRCA